MSAQQPKALRLADTFDHPLPPEWSDMQDAAAELRRLHVENEAQKKVLRAYMDTISHFHHAVADAGWHPGRTDDLLTDIIRSKGEELRCLHAANLECMEGYKAVKSERDELLEALKACDEAMSYMSEYDIPITLPAQVKAAIAKAIG